jgi:hypothetical protein
MKPKSDRIYRIFQIVLFFSAFRTEALNYDPLAAEKYLSQHIPVEPLFIGCSCCKKDFCFNRRRIDFFGFHLESQKLIIQTIL